MKKYIIITLLPFMLQSKIYGDANLNKVIQPYLISARRTLNNTNVPLELDPILQALVSFAKRGQNQSIEAINKIKDIGAALQQYKSDQYSAWSWYFGPTPQIVIDHIDPAIAKVDNALKTLKNYATNSGWLTIAARAASVLALVGIGVGVSWYAKQKNNERFNIKVENALKELHDAQTGYGYIPAAANYQNLFNQAQQAYNDSEGEDYTNETLDPLYEIFGLSSNATDDMVDQKYFELIQQPHELTQQNRTILNKARNAIVFDAAL